jgi:hypothetical protein
VFVHTEPRSAKRQHRPTPPTALPFSSFLAAALLPRRSNVEIEVPPNLWRVDPDPVGTFKRSNVFSFYPFCPQTLTDLPTQRPQPKSFEIKAFRTLFLATEGIPLASHSGTHSRLCICLSFQSLAGTHFATSFFSNSCRNGGCTPLPGAPDRTGALALSFLSATLMALPASVANKDLTSRLNSLDATLTKTGGGGLLFSDIQTFGL